MTKPLSCELSFIIPHMGRENMLCQTIDSIGAQHFALDQVEVIVATKNHALTLADLPQIDNLRISLVQADPALTISHQRNLAASHAKGKHLAFLDADVCLAPNWIEAMLTLLKSDGEIKLVSAIQKNSDNAPPLEQLRTFISNAHIDCEVEFLPGRNLLLSAETFDESGGFPEHLVTCEDYVFTQRVHQQGKLIYSSNSTYIHLGEDKAFWPMAKKEVWRGQSNIASLSGRKVPSSEWPSFIAPPIFTLGLFAAVIALLAGALLWSSVFLIPSVLVLLLYTFRLYRISKGGLSLSTILSFYSLYFPARTWGTVKGFFN
ncbi:glycosyltransferase [Glaciecola siphonariae]|uniref:Glycosyltransferase n=1 Tax=Glaciecola siphonariae TaxID=521012 RepID=A0ABV9LUF2_9ALTE